MPRQSGDFATAKSLVAFLFFLNDNDDLLYFISLLCLFLFDGSCPRLPTDERRQQWEKRRSFKVIQP